VFKKNPNLVIDNTTCCCAAFSCDAQTCSKISPFASMAVSGTSFPLLGCENNSPGNSTGTSVKGTSIDGTYDVFAGVAGNGGVSNSGWCYWTNGVIGDTVLKYSSKGTACNDTSACASLNYLIGAYYCGISLYFGILSDSTLVAAVFAGGVATGSDGIYKWATDGTQNANNLCDNGSDTFGLIGGFSGNTDQSISVEIAFLM